VDVLNIVTDPRSAYTTLYHVANGKNAPEIPIYPGYAVRHPAGGKDPVGELWPEHPQNAQNRIIHRVSKDFNEKDWPVLPNKDTQFFRTDGRYTLKYEYKPGPLIFGGGGKRIYFWQHDSTVLGG
jgi:hypothetical protein